MTAVLGVATVADVVLVYMQINYSSHNVNPSHHKCDCGGGHGYSACCCSKAQKLQLLYCEPFAVISMTVVLGVATVVNVVLVHMKINYSYYSVNHLHHKYDCGIRCGYSGGCCSSAHEDQLQLLQCAPSAS